MPLHLQIFEQAHSKVLQITVRKMVRVDSLTINQLEEKLKEFGLTTSGSKAQLIQRVVESVGEETEDLPQTDDVKAEIDGLKGEVTRLNDAVTEILRLLKTNDEARTV